MKTAPRMVLIVKWESLWAILRRLEPKRDVLHGDTLSRKNLFRPPWDFFITSAVKKRRRVSQVSHILSVKTRLRRLKQTRYFWPFNSWQLIATQPVSTKTSMETLKCQSHSTQQNPRLAGNLRSLNYSKIFAKQTPRVTTSWLKMTKSNISTLS